MSYFDHKEAHNEPFIKEPAHISTRDVDYKMVWAISLESYK